MQPNSEHVFLDAFLAGLRPDPAVTVDEWADEHRYLSQKASAEPGKWRTSRTPYLKKIMQCLSVSHRCTEIVFQKGAQVGGTEAGLNWVGYVIDHVPGPTLLVQPTVELGKRLSKGRLDPLIEACPRLSEKIGDPRSRDSSNTMMAKEFPGGILAVTGANSAVGLRSMAVKNLFLDEIDAYPDDCEGEGSPIALAEARTRTFARRKVLKVSTPTVEGRSKIQAAFELSNMQHYHVPCPFCKRKQALRWEQIRYDPQDIKKTIHYECELCEGKILEHHKTQMFERGQWIADNSDVDDVQGFHLSSLYSPVGWYSWAQAAKDYEKARESPELLRVFTNTVLGLTFRERGDAPNWHRLYERREAYRLRTVPSGGLVLTCGVDVQGDRLEAEIVAWGRDKQSWSVDYVVISGDTATQAPWDELAKLTTSQYPHETAGVLMPIRLMAIDSGFNTAFVHDFVRKFPPSRVIAVKGQDGVQTLVGQPKTVEINSRGKRITSSAKRWPVGVSVIKAELYGWLRLDAPTDGKPYPQGYCHFPMYGPEYFQMLTAEEMQRRIVRGFPSYDWVKIRPRNEALDARVYARAASVIVGIDRWQDASWDELEEGLGIGVPLPAQEVHDVSKIQPVGETAPVIVRKRSSFW